MSTERSRLPSLLAAAEPPYLGGWCHIPGGFSAEIAAAAGFDWCCVDRQHGMLGEAEMIEMVRALTLTGTPTLVRVSGCERAEIGRALDAGADGVIVPVIGSAAEARAAAEACAFPPDGSRSWATTRSKLYQDIPDPEVSNRSITCLPMVETAGALREVEEIAMLPGVDALFAGPADLRIELGLSEAELEEACRSVVGACAAAEKPAGVFAGGADRVGYWLDLGFEVVAIQSDSALLLGAAREAVASGRAAAGEAR